MPAPSHAELRKLVDDHEQTLRDTWARHRNADDILLLCDLRDEGCYGVAAQQHGKAAVDRVLGLAAINGQRPMLACLQPAAFATELGRRSSFAQREASKELRGFMKLSGLGFIPLLVVLPGGHWATQWADPDSNAVVVRYDPGVTSETN